VVAIEEASDKTSSLSLADPFTRWRDRSDTWRSYTSPFSPGPRWPLTATDGPLAGSEGGVSV